MLKFYLRERTEESINDTNFR